LKLDAAVGGINAYGQIDELLIDKKLQFLVFALLGLSNFKRFLGKDNLERRAFKGIVSMLNDDHVVAAGGDTLNLAECTVSMRWPPLLII